MSYLEVWLNFILNLLGIEIIDMKWHLSKSKENDLVTLYPIKIQQRKVTGYVKLNITFGKHIELDRAKQSGEPSELDLYLDDVEWSNYCLDVGNSVKF